MKDFLRQIIIAFDPTDRPVAHYAELWGKDAKTLNAWCAKGWVPGAWKHPSGEWWVHPLSLVGFDIGSVGETLIEKRPKRTPRKSVDRLPYPGSN